VKAWGERASPMLPIRDDIPRSTSRSLGRRTLRFVAWGGAVLGLLAGASALVEHFSGARHLRRARASFVREVLPLVRAESCRYGRTDPRNGASWYLAAAKALPRPAPERPELGRIVQHPPGTWSAADVRRVTSFLAAQQQALTWAHAGALRPVCDLVPESALIDQDFTALFRLARLLLAEAGVELRSGNQVRAASAVDTLEALGVGLHQGPFLLPETLGTAVMGNYLRALDWLVESDAVSVATLEALRAKLPRGSSHEILARAMAGEGSLAWRWSQNRGRGIRGFCCADQLWASFLDGYRPVLSWTSLTYRQARQAFANLEHEDADVARSLNLLGPYDALGAIGKCQAVEASRQLAAISLDLRIGAAVSGDFPVRLPAAQANLVDPFTGAHPVYSRAARGAQVSNPAAAAEYQELTGPNAPPFAWKLPAPAR
jgi:hypothetical protein